MRFLQLQKLKTDLSGTSTIIIKANDILQVSEIQAQNKVTQQTEIVRQIILVGYPEYAFMTYTPLLAFESTLKAVDITGGLGLGSSCLVPGVLDIVNVDSSYPMVKLWRIKNTITTLIDPLLVNLNYLYFAEEVPFTDEVLQTQVSAMVLSFQGDPLRKTVTNASLSNLVAILEPIIL